MCVFGVCFWCVCVFFGCVFVGVFVGVFFVCFLGCVFGVFQPHLKSSRETPSETPFVEKVRKIARGSTAVVVERRLEVQLAVEGVTFDLLLATSYSSSWPRSYGRWIGLGSVELILAGVYDVALILWLLVSVGSVLRGFWVLVVLLWVLCVLVLLWVLLVLLCVLLWLRCVVLSVLLCVVVALLLLCLLLDEILLLHGQRAAIEALLLLVSPGVASFIRPLGPWEVLVVHLLVDTVLGLIDQPVVLLVGATHLEVDGVLEVIAQMLQPEALVHLAGGVDSGGLSTLGSAGTRSGSDINDIVLLFLATLLSRSRHGVLTEIAIDQPIGGLLRLWVRSRTGTGAATEGLLIAGRGVAGVLLGVN